MNKASIWLKSLALLHLLVGVVFYREPLLAWLAAGVFNAVEPHWDRVAAFWFMVVGALLYGWGQLATAFEARGEPLPVPFVQIWLALGVVGTLAMPISGFPLVALAALMTLRRQGRWAA